MECKDFLGLLKFFRNEEYLDSLINGKLYFNTPEYYRLSGNEGISDKNESCSISFRKSRNDKGIKITFGGNEIPGITAFTMYSDESEEKWLHCWTALHFPNNNSQSIYQLVNDINRMRKEFGSQYVFVQNDCYESFVQQLNELSGNKISHGHVSYSDDCWSHSIWCKSKEYSYQREYRFVIGNCNHTSIDPFELTDKDGFGKFISKNPVIEIIERESNLKYFHLDKEQCYTEICT